MGVLTLSLLLVSASPTEHEWRRYQEVCEKLHLDALLKVPERERDHLAVRLSLAPAKAPTTRVTLTIVAAAGPIVVAPGPDGLTDFPVRAALWAENPMVLTSVPDGVKTAITLTLLPVLAPALRLSYADAMLAVTQANRLIVAQAGFFAFAAPRMKGLELHFPAELGATVEGLPGGPRKADAKGVVRVTFEEPLVQQDPALVLSTPPSSFDFFD